MQTTARPQNARSFASARIGRGSHSRRRQHKDIKSEVKEGRFREDLYYRLGVIEIEVPPLRDRKEDIVSLARHLVAKTATRLGMAQLRLDSTALDCLNSHDWPGNVRELENVLERAAVLCRDGVIRPEDLPPGIAQATGSQTRPQAGGDQSLREVGRQHIQPCSNRGGNRTRAKILGIAPPRSGGGSGRGSARPLH